MATIKIIEKDGDVHFYQRTTKNKAVKSFIKSMGWRYRQNLQAEVIGKEQDHENRKNL